MKGYMILREANIPEKAKEMVDIWTDQKFDYDVVKKAFKKCEKPMADGSPGYRIHIGYGEEGPGNQEPSASFPAITSGDPGTPSTSASIDSSDEFHMEQSLFVHYDNFDDELLEDALPDLLNSEVVWVAGDFDLDAEIDEDTAVAVYANYQQVRKFLHKKALARGYKKASPPRGGRGGRGRGGRLAIKDKPRGGKPMKKHGIARPKPTTKSHLKKNSRCARCGQKGHWARECTNPPDD